MIGRKHVAELRETIKRHLGQEASELKTASEALLELLLDLQETSAYRESRSFRDTVNALYHAEAEPPPGAPSPGRPPGVPRAPSPGGL